MHRICLTGLVPVVFCAAAAAQTPPVVTEAEFLSVLDEVHPAAVLEARTVAAARARLVATETLENPALGVVREDPSGPVAETAWTLSWRLPDPGRRLEIRAREQAVAAAEAGLERGLLTLRLEMKAAYAEWALATTRRRLLAAQAARIELLAERERTRAERGESSGLEARRLALAAERTRGEAALAAAEAFRRRAEAARWNPALPAAAEPVLPALPAVPDPPGADPSLPAGADPLRPAGADPSQPVGSDPSKPAGVERAPSGADRPTPRSVRAGLEAPLDDDHPMLRSARAELAAATLARAAAGRFWSSPELLAGWKRQEELGGSVDGPVVGVAWSLPVFDRGRAARAAADARVAAARARLETARRDLAAGRAAAEDAYRRLRAAAEGAEATLAESETMLAAAAAAFRHGEASLTDYLEIHRSVAEAETARLDLLAAALEAHRELERLAGPTDP